MAEVGAAYLTERELTEQLAVARQTLKAARDTYDLTKRSYEAGVLSELDLSTAETQRANRACRRGRLRTATRPGRR